MDPIDSKKSNDQLSAAVTAAISIKMEFELFSYRITSPEVFISQVKAIAETLNESLNKINED